MESQGLVAKRKNDLPSKGYQKLAEENQQLRLRVERLKASLE